jgi:hypothetical protein
MFLKRVALQPTNVNYNNNQLQMTYNWVNTWIEEEIVDNLDMEICVCKCQPASKEATWGNACSNCKHAGLQYVLYCSEDTSISLCRRCGKTHLDTCEQKHFYSVVFNKKEIMTIMDSIKDKLKSGNTFMTTITTYRTKSSKRK